MLFSNMKLYFILILLITSSISIHKSHTSKSSNDDVRIIAQIFRHGHRSSLLTFNNTHIKGGELTQIGKTEAIIKGANFLQKFPYFLSKEFNHNEIKTFSSIKRRNILTLVSRLHGLYPDKILINQLETLNDTDLITHLEDSIQTIFPNDYMFTIFHNQNCFRRIQGKFLSHPKYYEMKAKIDGVFNKHRDLLDKYLSHFSNNWLIVVKIIYIADYFDRHIENEIVLTEEEILIKNKMHKFYKILNDMSVDESSIISLFTSKMYETILNYFEKKINENSEEKLLMFAAHDISMSAMLLSLGEDVTEYEIGFNSEINFVLSKIDDEYYVSAEYEEKSIRLKFCEGRISCEYEKFKNYLTRIINDEKKLEKFCNGELESLINDVNKEVIKDEI